MTPELKTLALELYKPPFRHIHGYIQDANGLTVADDAAGNAALRIRGWGRIQYMKDPEALQDGVAELIADALTEYWRRMTQPEAQAALAAQPAPAITYPTQECTAEVVMDRAVQVGTIGHYSEVASAILDACAGLAAAEEAASATDAVARPKPGSEPPAWKALQALECPHKDQWAAHVWTDAITTAMRVLLTTPAQATPEGGQDERAGFVKWARDYNLSPESANFLTGTAWAAWQARAALAASQQAAEPFDYFNTRKYPDGSEFTFSTRKGSLDSFPLYRAAPPQQDAADTARLEFVIKQRSTWYPGYYGEKWQADNSRGTLCYGHDRAMAEGATMREAIDAARAAMSKKGGAA